MKLRYLIIFNKQKLKIKFLTKLVKIILTSKKMMDLKLHYL
jgi:hypothetical protein